MVDFNVVVVIPAAGFGERMGTSTPKQYSSIAGQQVYIYTIKAFHRIPWIQNIIVCVSKENQSRSKAIIRDFGLTRVTVVVGGSSRHRSIRNGVQEVKTVSTSPDVVLIHDGVRPLVDPELLKDIATTAKLHGASGVVRPLVSTVIGRDSDGFLECSLDRQKYCASEMPQGFQFRVIESAYEQCSDYDLDYGTECLHLAQKYTGVRAKLLDGPESLWKVTYKKDLHAASGMLRETFISVGVLESSPNGFTKSLHDHLQCQGNQAQICDETSLSKMAASLIWERNECFSGQLFIVDA